MDYCSAVWDPHHEVPLESVQMFAARVTTKQRRTVYPTLLLSLNWHPLTTRRKIQKLKVCCNILHNLSCIPPFFVYHPYPALRHCNSKTLLKPFARTDSYKFSFFVDVVQILEFFVVDCRSSFSLNHV